MLITPFVAALWLGSTFWTGVAASSLVHNDGWNGWGAAPAAEVTIGAGDHHHSACMARYHSYGSNPAYPDSWMGRDGQWHVCTL